jgi:hypothetical protein
MLNYFSWICIKILKWFFIAFVWPYKVNCMLYINTIYNIKILYITYHIIHTLHYTVPHCAPMDSTMQWEVEFLSQHSTSIFFICLFLDNDYETIISFKLVLSNISLNMNMLKIICTISKLALKVLCLIGNVTNDR